VSPLESNAEPRSKFRLGPGFLVTAAFIGPGTVTAASSAGYLFGLHLLWVIPLSTLAAILLQEMAGRIGLVTQKPLGTVLREVTPGRKRRMALCSLIFIAILFGNTAYQGGNLLGASKGLDILTGGQIESTSAGPLLALTGMALIAGLLLLTGSPRLVSRFLIGLVMVMSLLFLGIAFQVFPTAQDVAQGLRPQVPQGGLPETLALFGTTIVPYNLFLYASLVRDKWPNTTETHQAIRASRLDIVLAVGLGGLVTAAILLTGAAAAVTEVPVASKATFALNQLPEQLQHLMPRRLAGVILGLGLLGAGLSSAITAPMAACYAAAGIFDWPTDLRTQQNRCVLGIVLLAGWSVAAAGILWEVKPEYAIILAQAANGLILPILALLLWWLASQNQVLGEYVNGRAVQTLTFLVVLALSTVWLLNLGGILWARFFAG
jgi:manganese transport protein